jgi:hypothetical protein
MQSEKLRKLKKRRSRTSDGLVLKLVVAHALLVHESEVDVAPRHDVAVVRAGLWRRVHHKYGITRFHQYLRRLRQKWRGGGGGGGAR